MYLGSVVMVYLTCAVIDLGGRGEMKHGLKWLHSAPYKLTSDLTFRGFLVSPQSRHLLQVRKVLFYIGLVSAVA